VKFFLFFLMERLETQVLKGKSRAQALVEFSLVVVLLFMLIFGILEVGRLLFVYAAVITSSREAVRYGSVSGVNDDGNLHYQDCAGIRDTARRLAFFQNLQDDDILIEYDTGPGTTPYGVCDDLSDGVADGVDSSVNPATGDRIVVTVTGSFDPIVPIVPLNVQTIVSTSSRTILGIIPLE
jgi:Flp pilus assembly protein TadG